MHIANKNKDYIINSLKSGISLIKIAKELGITDNQIRYYIGQWGLINASQIKFDHNYFEQIDTEEKAYWLGFLMADGCVYINADNGLYRLKLTLSIIDIQHLYRFNSCLSGNRKPVIDKKKQATLIFSSKKLCNDLIKNGCIQRKTFLLEFPYIEHTLIRHFIRGYVDGDGCFTKLKGRKTKQLEFSVIGTMSMLEQMQQYLMLNNKIYQRGNVFTIRAAGNKQVRRIASYLYKDAAIFLQRKYDVCASILGNGFERI
jgi:intein-encoded DNA endonuclease-like protein